MVWWFGGLIVAVEVFIAPFSVEHLYHSFMDLVWVCACEGVGTILLGFGRVI